MNITYNNNLNTSYMVIEETIEEPAEDASFSVRMLSENDIPHLLKFSLEHVNGRTHYLYDITSLQSFSKAYENEKLTRETLFVFLKSFQEMVSEIEDHLLDCNDILLQGSSIYMDDSHGKYYFCCVPGLGQSIRKELARFSGEMLMMIDYEDPAAVKIAFDLNRMAASEGFSMASLSELTKEDAMHIQTVTDVLGDGESVYVHGEIQNIPKENADIYTSQTNAYVHRAETKDSFIGQLKGYFKGRKIMEVLDDINSGGVIGRIKAWRPQQEGTCEEDTADSDFAQISYQMELMNAEGQIHK